MNFTKITSSICAVVTAVSCTIPVFADNYSWADTEVEYCQENNIMNGDENGNLNLGDSVTRAQAAKMLTEAFDLSGDGDFDDISPNDWYYGYAKAIRHCMASPGSNFNGDEALTREEFAATLVRARGYSASSLCNPDILTYNFADAQDVSDVYSSLLAVAVEKAYYRGDNGYLRPKDELTRAEVCAMLYRVLEAKNGNITLTWEDLGVIYSETPIIGEARVSEEAAIAWAQAHNCSDIFTDAAQYYWKYGELTGIRPEVLYAQAAKETGYGRYGGKVLPEMNNFAGIKKYGATGDATEDHESFATREDGVRAHFNHMCAYVGLEPIGEVHGRYYSVMTLPWAGTVQYVEALGGKWCPDLYYGYDVVRDFIDDMKTYDPANMPTND